MKTAQRIGVLLLLTAVSGCGSRKALTRTHYAERDSSMVITQKEMTNTRQCTGKQVEAIETFSEETTLMIRKDTTGLKLTRTVSYRKRQNTKSNRQQEKWQQTDTTQYLRKQIRTEENEKETQKLSRSATSFIIVLTGVLVLLLLFRRRYHYF